MNAPGYMDIAAIADRIGVKRNVALNYHQLAQRRRREGAPRPGDLPEPTARFGRTPVWLESTVEDWIASRPGKGAGGGRPWHRERKAS